MLLNIDQQQKELYDIIMKNFQTPLRNSREYFPNAEYVNKYVKLGEFTEQNKY